MRHRWVAVLAFLILALVIAFVFKNEMEKMNGGTPSASIASEEGFSQKVENAIGDFGKTVADILS